MSRWHLRWVLWWVMLLSLTGCGNPAPIPVAQLSTYEGRAVSVAGAIVIQSNQVWLVAHVVTMPDVPVQVSAQRYPMMLPWMQQQLLPWRDADGIRYVPAVVTGEFRHGVIENVSHIDTDMREQTVVHHDIHRLIRLVGHLHTHPDGTYIHDQYQPDQSRGFWPAWNGDDAPIRLAEGAEILIEGVRVDERIIPVVIAPVIEKSQ
ncbi:MAG: hypothetical protein ACK5GU_00520 [Chloroflexota bacterium]|jgi:hypothetical protein